MSVREFKIDEILTDIENYAPVCLAESWDHVGLMVGDRSGTVKNVVLSLDADRDALNLCEEEGAGLLITHHPLLFRPLTEIDYQTSKGALVRDFIRKNITVYSAHTNLDKTTGGVNHVFAELAGLTSPMSITGVSVGLCGELNEVTSLFYMVKHLKKLLGAGAITLNTDSDREVARIFVQGGSFDADSIPELIKARIDLVIAGEIHYHDLMDLRAAGIAAFSIGHDVSERIILPTLEKRLNLQFPALGVAIAEGLDYNKNVF